MSKCIRETCIFLSNSGFVYCCAGCQANGVHGAGCEGIVKQNLSLAKNSTTNNNLPGPAFDLSRCEGGVNQDGSVTVTIPTSLTVKVY